jgi:hypothetical protein
MDGGPGSGRSGTVVPDLVRTAHRLADDTDAGDAFFG